MEVFVDVEKKFIIEKIDARSLKLIPYFNSYKLVKNNDTIEELIFSDKYHYKVGEYIDTDYGRYYIQKIKKSISYFVIESCDFSLTSFFMLPLVLNNYVDVRNNKYLYNAYLSKEDIMNEEKTISIILRTENKEEYDLLEKDLFEDINYKSFEDRGEFIIFKFVVPQRFKNVFSLYLDGKYSHFTLDAKNRIISYSRNEANLLRQIFERSEKRRKALLDSLNIEDSEVPKDLELLSKPSKKECIEFSIL